MDEAGGRSCTPRFVVKTEATFHAIDNGRLLASAILRTRTRWNSVISARRDAGAWKIADLLALQPVVNTQLLQFRLGLASAAV